MHAVSQIGQVSAANSCVAWTPSIQSVYTNCNHSGPAVFDCDGVVDAVCDGDGVGSELALGELLGEVAGDGGVSQVLYSVTDKPYSVESTHVRG